MTASKRRRRVPRGVGSSRRSRTLRFVLILASGLSGFLQGLIAQTEYTGDGVPTALEEEIRWLMNRARFDSAHENQTRSTTYTDVPATAGPLAPHESLALASRHHSEDMARQNVFQHETVPGSAYYNATTQPQPWDRMRAEGYSWSRAAENIAAGYGTAEAAYVGWWKSTGHRVNMCNAQLREVGNGYFFWSASTYDRYYTMDLGSSGSTHFFTDTVFRDANNDGTYDQGEGVAGMRVRLRVNGAFHSSFDLSSPVGSFAVSIQTISDGASVEVLVANPTGAAVTLTVPRGYAADALVTLAAGEEVVLGTFTQPAGTFNVGIRNLVPVLPPLTPPVLALVRSGPNVELRWSSQAGVQYVPQWTTDFSVWQDLSSASVPGTGGEMVLTDVLPSVTQGCRVYRLVVQRP